MNWHYIATVYGKELRDMLRDRRTLISMIVIPTLIMPVLMGVGVMVSLRVQRDVVAAIPTIMLLGGEDSPKLMEALRAKTRIQIQPLAGNWRQLIADKKLRAVLEVPRAFDATLEQGGSAAVKVYNYEGEGRSGVAVRELRNFFDGYGREIVVERLKARGLAAEAIKPLELKSENVAPPERVGGNVIGGIIPYFFLMLAFTGAMYPAMDLTAGEKERGTMETLLCSPIPRVNIVLGKFFMILTASLGTLVCSLVSMTLTASVGGSLIARQLAGGGPGGQRAAEKLITMTTLDPVGLVAVVAMVLPMIVLFAAGLFAISLFAKSFKEAQSYVSPLMIVIIMPAMIGMLPGIELSARLALVPILNVSLASKELVSGVFHWNYLALIFGSTCVYATIALAAAVKMFNREDVIFRA